MKKSKFVACAMAALALSFSAGVCNTDVPIIGHASVAEAFDWYTVGQYQIDPSSVWCSDNNHFGAGVTDTDTGEYFTALYQLVPVKKNVIDVMESKNSEAWVQIGTIDWNYMCSADVGNAQSGGKLFRRIADLGARSLGYEKMF